MLSTTKDTKHTDPTTPKVATINSLPDKKALATKMIEHFKEVLNDHDNILEDCQSDYAEFIRGEQSNDLQFRAKTRADYFLFSRAPFFQRELPAVIFDIRAAITMLSIVGSENNLSLAQYKKLFSFAKKYEHNSPKEVTEIFKILKIEKESNPKLANEIHLEELLEAAKQKQIAEQQARAAKEAKERRLKEEKEKEITRVKNLQEARKLAAEVIKKERILIPTWNWSFFGYSYKERYDAAVALEKGLSNNYITEKNIAHLLKTHSPLEDIVELQPLFKKYLG